MVLLVVGIVLAIGGLRGPADFVTEPAMQGDDVGGAALSIDPGAPAAGDPAGAGELSSEDRTDQQPATAGPTDPGSAGGGSTTAVPTTDVPTGADDPVAALEGLVELRAAAFGTADPDVLRAVDVDPSPAMDADQEAVEVLEQAGTGLRDLSITVREATLLTGSELSARPAVASLPGIAGPPADVEVAVIRSTVQMSSYTTETTPDPVGGAADDPEPGPPPLMAAGAQQLVFVLWRTADGWRIHSVVEPW